MFFLGIFRKQKNLKKCHEDAQKIQKKKQKFR